MALQGYYTPYPLPTNIENQEEAWNIPFDRNSSRQEFNKRPTTEIDYKWKLYLSFHFTDVYPDTKLEYRCRLDKEAPIGYYTNRLKVRIPTICHKEFVTDPYDERYKKSISLAEQLRSKHYKNVGSGHEDTPYNVKGYDYIIFEKTFMFIKLLNCSSGQKYRYLLPAILTQKCTAIVEQTRAYYPKTASGTINKALDEFIRRKHNPTQKEVTDFLVNLIWDKEIYLSEEPSFLAKTYETQYEQIRGHLTLVPHSFEQETTFVKANFIANTDTNAILSSIGYIR
ncbi:hypothetical protein [Parabacteroides distasonis]|jgi:hypothetical protein|uniref:hypothetical protein n=1 Tax=Bacteroidales TaxID=171549 RepID=UPI002806354E|nr:hypothetical protein [Parabacteroides distasonis]WMI42924.1 hypothetical protein Q8809_00950 [Parabacteroides distasonis]